MAKSFPNTGATVIDTASDLPAASAALEGVMMFQKNTNELKICDGSNWISMLDTDSPSGLHLINPTSVANATNSNGAISFASVSSFSVNGVFSNTFKKYRIIMESGASSASNINVSLKLRVNGSDNSSNYYWRGIYNNGTIASTAAGPTGSAFVGDTANLSSLLTIDIANPFSSGPTGWLANSSCFGSSTNQLVIVGGLHWDSTPFDGFSLNPQSGTFSGSIRVYGCRNSI